MRSSTALLKMLVYCKAPILWSPDAKSQLTGKNPNAGVDQGQEERGVTKDEMVGWHHLTQWTSV